MANAEETCPVCGYYCLGNGGIGCIDKPALEKDNMAKVVRIYEKVDTVRKALVEAAEEDYDEIIIIGLSGDELKVRWSKIEDQFKIAGCLEIAKMDILK